MCHSFGIVAERTERPLPHDPTAFAHLSTTGKLLVSQEINVQRSTTNELMTFLKVAKVVTPIVFDHDFLTLFPPPRPTHFDHLRSRSCMGPQSLRVTPYIGTAPRGRGLPSFLTSWHLEYVFASRKCVALVACRWALLSTRGVLPFDVWRPHCG